MKIKVFIFLIIISVFVINGKIYTTDYAFDKGSFHLGYYLDVTSSLRLTVINPSFGYFILNHLEIGPVFKNEIDNLSYGIKTILYIGNKNNNIFPYLGIAYVLEKITHEDYYSSEFYKKVIENSEKIIPHIGFCFMLSPKFSTGIEFQYHKSINNSNKQYTNYDEEYKIGIQFSGYLF